MLYKESERVELKAVYSPDVKKEVIAFANSDGGTVYIGIDDDGTFVGLQDEDSVMQQTANALRDGVRPDITMFTKLSFIQMDNLVAIKIEVSQGTRRPYYLSDKGLRPSGVYVRQGTTSAPASEDAIRRFIQLTDGDAFEENRSLFQDLTFIEFTKEMRLRSLDCEEIHMKNIGIITQDNLYSNLGLLVSDQCLHTTKMAVFEGTSKMVFKNRKEFTGSLFRQIDEAFQAIDFYNETRASFGSLMRTDLRSYPVEAVREALLNAIVHRDYSFSGSTFINIYSDRLEFISLGGLVPGLSLEAAMLGASQPRNVKLAALFYRMKLIEAYGTGFNKIMSSYVDALEKPVIKSVDGAFCVILPKMQTITATISEPNETRMYDKMVLSLAKKHPNFSRSMAQTELGMGTTRTLQILNQMEADGLIQRVGSGKNTRYIEK